MHTPLLRAAAVLQPRRVVVVFQQLYLIRETKSRTHAHLVVRLILAVPAHSLALAAEHGGQGVFPCYFCHIVRDAVLVAPAFVPRLAGGGVFFLFIGKVEGKPRVDHGLTAQHILIVAAGHIDIGKHLIVRFPLDNTAGAASLVGFLLQAAHVLALFKVQMVVVTVAVDIGGHPCRGVLGGAQTQTVQAKAELVVILAFAVLAARVHLAEQQLPVEAPLAVVPVHGHTAAKVLHNDAAVLAAGHVAFNQIETLATSVKNNDGVYLVPAFTGLGAPWWKPDAKAAIWGMTLNAGKAHVLRAGLESIAYQVKDLIDMMTRQAGIELKALRVDGGPTKNQFLMQFQADMLHAVINRSEIEEASALGAVVMNGFARKKWASFQEAAAMRTIDNCIAPCMEEKELQSLYSGWREAVKKVIGQNN